MRVLLHLHTTSTLHATFMTHLHLYIFAMFMPSHPISNYSTLPILRSRVVFLVYSLFYPPTSLHLLNPLCTSLQLLTLHKPPCPCFCSCSCTFTCIPAQWLTQISSLTSFSVTNLSSVLISLMSWLHLSIVLPLLL